MTVGSNLFESRTVIKAPPLGTVSPIQTESAEVASYQRRHESPEPIDKRCLRISANLKNQPVLKFLEASPLAGRMGTDKALIAADNLIGQA